jgi:uncharacterized protein (TIGR03437 family)
MDCIMRNQKFVVLSRLALCCSLGVCTVAGAEFGAHYVDIGGDGKSVAAAVDSSGNYYVLSSVTKSSGSSRIRVTKTDADGAVLKALDFGGSDTDTPASVAIDPGGYVVVAGSTTSTDFPVTITPANTASGSAAFVVKLDPRLDGIVASRLIRGNQYGSGNPFGSVGRSLVIDTAGSVYLAGSTDALDFPVTAGAYQSAPPGYDGFGTARYGFLVKLSSDLTRVQFGTYFGSDQTACSGGSACLGVFATTDITSLALDPSGAPVVGGDSTATGLPTTSGAVSATCNCAHSDPAGFAAKFSPDGTQLIWSTYLSREAARTGAYGSAINVRSVVVDSSGNVILAGRAPDGFPVTAGAAQAAYPVPTTSSSSYPYAGFVAKLNSTGTGLVFSTYFGSAKVGSEGVTSVALGTGDSLWLTGSSLSVALPGAVTSTLGPPYVASLSSDGGTVSNVILAPPGGAGTAIIAGPAGRIAGLGALGSLLLPADSGSPQVLGVANSAGTQVSGRIAPLEAISFYGSGLGPSSPLAAQVNDGVVAGFASGYAVLFNGVAAPLLYMGESQINCVVPSSVSGQDTVAVQILTPAGTYPGPVLFAAPAQPEVFRDVNGFAYALNQDGSVNTATNPAAPGSAVSIWVTGLGEDAVSVDGTIATASRLSYPVQPVSVLTSSGEGGTTSLEVLYAGDAPGNVQGVSQINLRLPDTLSLASTSAGAGVRIQAGAVWGEWAVIHVKP